MTSIKITAHVGLNGTLTLAVPTLLCETDVEVMVVVQPIASPNERAGRLAFPRQQQAAGRGNR